MKFETLKTEAVYQGRLLVVKRDTVKYPNGEEHDYDIIHHPGSVVMVPVDEEGQIWLIDQYRHAIGGMLLELPAGTIRQDEDPQVCAVRELREEIGMTADNLKKIGEFYIAPGYTNEYMHVYLTMDLRKAPLQQDSGEFIQVKKVSSEAVYQMIAEDKIRDAKTLAGLALAKPYILQN
jgi:ADP-ribose pyrophosphatase